MDAYKKLAAIFAFLSLVFLANSLYFFWHYTAEQQKVADQKQEIKRVKAAQKEVVEDDRPSSVQFKRVSNCSTYECLFENSEGIEGLATFQGYYTSYNTTERDGSPVKCDALHVTYGNYSLKEEIIQTAKNGNGINRLSENEELILTLDLSKLSAQDKQKLHSSTGKNPVDVLVLRGPVRGMDVNSCFSEVNILKVEKRPQPSVRPRAVENN